MIPTAIPTVGGMAIETITMFVVPALFCWRQERKISTFRCLPKGNSR